MLEVVLNRVKVIRSSPMVLVMVAGILFASFSAFGQTSSSTESITSTGPTIVPQKNNNPWQYQDEGLKQKEPEELRGHSDVVKEDLTKVFKSMGERESTKDKLEKLQTVDRRRDYFYIHSAMAPYKPKTTDVRPIQDEMGRESGAAYTREVLAHVELFQRIAKGLNLSLDFTRQPKQVEPQGPRVRYGLVLQTVTPKLSPDRRRAAINASIDDEIQYSNESDVVWTIGPIYEDGNAKVFHANVDLNNYDFAAAEREELKPKLPEKRSLKEIEEDEEEEEQEDKRLAAESRTQAADKTFWSSGGLPKPQFHTKLRPTDQGKFSKVMSGKKKPGLKFTLTQQQGLYQYDLLHESNKNEQTHNLQLPLIGTFSVSRKFNDKMDVISTSANNILISDRYPPLTIHYFHDQGQYIGESSYNTSERVQLTFKVKGDATKVPDPQKDQRHHHRGAEVGLKTIF